MKQFLQRCMFPLHMVYIRSLGQGTCHLHRELKSMLKSMWFSDSVVHPVIFVNIYFFMINFRIFPKWPKSSVRSSSCSYRCLTLILINNMSTSFLVEFRSKRMCSFLVKHSITELYDEEKLKHNWFLKFLRTKLSTSVFLVHNIL